MNESEKHNAKQESAQEGFLPIVIDLGKVRTKRIKQLCEGKGPCVQKVEDALQDFCQQAKGNPTRKELLPVVLVYRKKRKKAVTLLNPLGT
jgi:hypothetical protein